MKRRETGIPGVAILEPEVHGDHRGYFMETYNQPEFARLGITQHFIQDNQSRSVQGVLRGLHWQIARPQAKLVRILSGEVFDVAVDIRRGSPTFGRWHGEVLSEHNRRSLFVGAGFAHGFLVLSPAAEFFYKVSDVWSPEAERGIRFDDPQVAIAWPATGSAPTLSSRDRAWGGLAAIPDGDLFRWNAANPEGI